ncbi:MAG TPA: methylenetetrahydrofolate--tRNA-(uracil(54)-C(5))-methyltransferase (FADH(2)-oxidizing) TrmFO [Lapidilactobacillus dextrinicus]|uniref:Methylenetetrahydrofolate--tRNA-(uracil-5-)-methyltransferase TrmFO n=2 Tax=Lapidilactobacillus dextrinicus TaxID=51664 RepID=A0A921B2L4_9LACO|nr:methylenetetrahydrofolate--tRNA-(uracil(54)-C(5))-methyltransferase (FADH(2)-oxidizing) TrmFO [Lapidilactobacillus dextrinicus]HJE14990.1 methylenetetrahydrofolate--tRNA-(uracil(54)-C(5))-methyltransferase (FADH(2)-oxidizing) TrmFO [Lapidilactobacillus dextrinicus]
MTDMPVVNVVGAGLAGSEAAWQIAQRGVKVRLYEMRPVKSTPAHHTDQFAELVCTNSLRANQITNAVGLLKEEMRRLNSLVMTSADANAVPAGGALAVDRDDFSGQITTTLREHPNIEVIAEELSEFPEGITVVATGPLTSPAMAEQIQQLNGAEGLHFYDAAAPILTKESIDFDKVYLKSRYDKGEAAYLNCPMTRDEFMAFRDALATAEQAEMHGFEDDQVFEGCMPIEVMARRGEKTMLFGPMKPVGLEDPKTDQRPYAVVQLRQDNAAGSLYNIVGFQTHLKWGEQRRIFRMIPGLENAEFVRYGVMHRNTFMNSPEVLQPTYESKQKAGLFFAGQMTGVEGYVESAASGLLAGINAARMAQGQATLTLDPATAIGSMANYITHTNGKHFQPMNANFGILAPLPEKIRDKKARYQALAKRALDLIDQTAVEVNA